MFCNDKGSLSSQFGDEIVQHRDGICSSHICGDIGTMDDIHGHGSIIAIVMASQCICQLQ